MNTLTERLNFLITNKGIKAVDLASAIEVNTSTISRVLKGTQIPTADTLYKTAKYFNVTMEYLIAGEISKPPCVDATFPDNKTQLLKYYDGMSESDKDDLLMIAEMKYNKSPKNNDDLGKSSHSGNENITSDIA